MHIATRINLASLRVRQLAWSNILKFGFSTFLGLGLGFLVSRGDWYYALALAALPLLLVLFCARPFIGVILWLLVMPLSSALPNPDLMYWAVYRILIPVTLCMAILPRMVKSSRLTRFKYGMPEVAIALLAGLVPVSIILTQTDIRLPFIKYADRILIPICMYLIMRLISLDGREIKTIEWTAFFIAIIQSTIGFLSWITPQLLPNAWHHLVGARTVGSLLDPAVFTSMLVFCTTLLFYAAMQRKQGLVRLLFLFACGLSMICVFISLERGSWVAGILVSLGLVVLYRQRVLRLIIVVVIAILILGAGFLSKPLALSSQRLYEQDPIDARLVVTDAMLHMIQVKPIFGWGFDTLNQNIEQYYRMVGSTSISFVFTTSHNTYLTIFTELGLVGFILYILPVIGLLIASFRIWRRRYRMGTALQLLLSTLWLAALHIFVVSNFMDMRFFPIGLTLWWMNLGMIANLVHQIDEENNRFLSPQVKKA